MVVLYGFLSTLNIEKACAASLRSDRFGSDATNDKQLSLASRVLHSGLDPESPQSDGDDLSLRITGGILNQVQDDERPSIIHHPSSISNRSSFLIPHSSLLRGAVA